MWLSILRSSISFSLSNIWINTQGECVWLCGSTQLNHSLTFHIGNFIKPSSCSDDSPRGVFVHFSKIPLSCCPGDSSSRSPGESRSNAELEDSCWLTPCWSHWRIKVSGDPELRLFSFSCLPAYIKQLREATSHWQERLTHIVWISHSINSCISRQLSVSFCLCWATMQKEVNSERTLWFSKKVCKMSHTLLIAPTHIPKEWPDDAYLRCI